MSVTPLAVINNFSPASGSGGSTVTINGSGFINVTSVAFNGVNASYLLNNPTQIAATVPGGTSTGVITVTTTCGSAASSTNFNFILANAVLNLKLFIEGFYTGGGLMNNNGNGGCLYLYGASLLPTDADSVFVSAMSLSAPHTEIEKKFGMLKTNGDVTVSFSPAVVAGNNYYIKISHRNSLETWSANSVLFKASTTYDFTLAQTQAFGTNPMVQTFDSFGYAILSGDINQDLNIDLLDFPLWDIDNGLFNFGYLPTDLNGDLNVDLLDFPYWDLNNSNFSFSQIP
jgi:hypothetical protein